jgi:hypothetical protein
VVNVEQSQLPSLPPPSGSRWKDRDVYTILAGILIAGIAGFFLLTLRPGHNWDGDYALYILHARNIVERAPYGDTGYVFNPQAPIHPAAYPPGLPLLLAPVYFFSGFDLHTMKTVGVGAFVLFLLIFARIARQWLPPAMALAPIALLGLHPAMWDFKDTIFSEFPFMLFCYAALYFVDGFDRMDPLPRRWAVAGAAIALALAALTRSIGIILFPITFLLALYRSRRLANPATWAVALAAGIVILAALLFPSDAGTYAGYFKDFSGLASIKENALRNNAAVGNLVLNELLGNRWLARGWGIVFLLLVLCGWIARTRTRLSVFELFFAAYLLFFMVYPLGVERSRYLMPLWPLFLLYAFRGACTVGASLGKTARFGAPALLFAAFCALYVVQYARTDFGPIPYSVTNPRSLELFEAIKTTVPADAAVLTRKPTIIALFTQRRAAVWPTDASDDDLWRYMVEVGARFIVDSPHAMGSGPGPAKSVGAFIDRHRSAFDVVFSNQWFTLYQVSAERATGGLGRPSSIE